MVSSLIRRFLFVFCSISSIISSFSPNLEDYDAYGLKIVANDILFVQAMNSEKTFLVQFAPYNYTADSLQCTLNFDDDTHYVYSVGVGIKQNITNSSYFYFAGEVTSTKTSSDSQGRNGTFIGIWNNRDTHNIEWYLNNRQPFSCDYLIAEKLQFFQTYDHQEYYVMAVEPYGMYAFGIASDFVVRYTPFPSVTTATKSGASVWPNNSTFYPCAADVSDQFTVVAGFVGSAARSRVRATPTVYLMWNSNMTIIATWSYMATNNSWQSRLSYSNILSWRSQYSMSVKINIFDSRRVLVGMPFLNTVFMFTVENNGTSLRLNSSRDNGNSVGFGKSVAWLTNSQAAILSLSYSMDWKTLYSSRVNIYTSVTGNEISETPSAVIPNAQQPLPSTLSSELIRLVSTPASLAILDSSGGAMIILAQQPGFYSSTDIAKLPIAATMPVVSATVICIGGTYKLDTGVHPCTLCPAGSRNSGLSPGLVCLNCSSTSYCPLGALQEVEATYLESVSQAHAFPATPELDVFDDILLAHMFSLSSSGRCLAVSPIFWILIMCCVVLIVLIVIAILNLSDELSKRKECLNTFKAFFQKTDLVGAGELWIGGLVSIGLIFMTIMAYVFAFSFLNQYPAEDVGPSNFACDTSLRNARYSSTLQPLAVPPPVDEKPMFDLLDQQDFSFNLDFLSTNISCNFVTITGIIGASKTVELTKQSCIFVNGIFSVSVSLSHHDMTVQVVLNDIHPVGGFRMGLSGPGVQNDSYVLLDLHFRKAFMSETGTLARKATVKMALTKVINETEPLSGSDSTYGGIWYPTFTYSVTDMFVSADTYAMSSNLSSTTIMIEISETSYYIKNVQSPIAKKAEVIFHTLLFSFLCLEICAIAFLISELMFIPIGRKILEFFQSRSNQVEPMKVEEEIYNMYF